MKIIRDTIAVLALILASLTIAHAQDPLPSWNDGAAKQAIVSFVQTTTETGNTNFVPPAERIEQVDAVADKIDMAPRLQPLAIEHRCRR